jgi:HSP20 family protein
MSRRAPAGVDAASPGAPFCGFFGREPTWTPAVNLYEDAVAYHVCVDLAGVDKEAIDVTVTPAQTPHDSPSLVIRGARAVPRTPAHGTDDDATASQARRSRPRVHRMEIDHGAFVREVDLPDDADQSAIRATYRSGMLWIELPKRAG